MPPRMMSRGSPSAARCGAEWRRGARCGCHCSCGGHKHARGAGVSRDGAVGRIHALRSASGRFTCPYRPGIATATPPRRVAQPKRRAARRKVREALTLSQRESRRAGRLSPHEAGCIGDDTANTCVKLPPPPSEGAGRAGRGACELDYMPTRKRASLNSSQREWLAPRGGGWEGGGVHTLPWARLLCTASRGAVFWRAPAAQQDARGRGSEAREKVFDPPGCMYVRTPRACARHTARVPACRDTEHPTAAASDVPRGVALRLQGGSGRGRAPFCAASVCLPRPGRVVARACAAPRPRCPYEGTRRVSHRVTRALRRRRARLCVAGRAALSVLSPERRLRAVRSASSRGTARRISRSHRGAAGVERSSQARDRRREAAQVACRGAGSWLSGCASAGWAVLLARAQRRGCGFSAALFSRPGACLQPVEVA